MADRRAPYYRQLVSETDATQWDDDLETADHNFASDLGFYGIMNGLVAAPHTPNNLSVDVSGGVGYDNLGQRIHVPSPQNVSLATDYLGASTAVGTPGNGKILSVFVQFTRALSDPVTDGNGNTVYYDRLESFEWLVVQGNETSLSSGSGPQPPNKVTNTLLVADITISYSSTGFVVTSSTPISTTRTDNLIVSPTWADGSSLQCDSILLALASIVAKLGSSGGADLALWVTPDTSAPGTLAASSLGARLSALRNSANLEFAGAVPWANIGSNPAASNPAQSVQSAIAGIISDLASNSTTDTRGDGAGKVGYDPSSDPVWANGATNVFPLDRPNVHKAITGLILDLSSNSGTDSRGDGASKVGAEAVYNFTEGTVRTQLDQCATLNGTNTYAAGSAENFSNSTVTLNPGATRLSPALSAIWRSAKTVLVLSTNVIGATDVSIPAGASGMQILDLPNGAVLTAVAVTIAGGSASPGQRFNMNVVSINLRNGLANESSVIANAADTTYGSTHNFTLQATGPGVAIDTSQYQYLLYVYGETGTGAAGVEWFGTQVQCTVSNAEFSGM